MLQCPILPAPLLCPGFQSQVLCFLWSCLLLWLLSTYINCLLPLFYVTFFLACYKNFLQLMCSLLAPLIFSSSYHVNIFFSPSTIYKVSPTKRKSTNSLIVDFATTSEHFHIANRDTQNQIYGPRSHLLNQFFPGVERAVSWSWPLNEWIETSAPLGKGQFHLLCMTPWLQFTFQCR